ncbi:SidA/IucD/PvdA family monooxygenase [Arthrobacter gandavensis]|uniref:lysine N(6)-hydroxylase/L-ornithine N(5)-oxygenase family protein n=1 Tax=Arthrobacter gandavensis TaxID=169960 RepID=UPI0018907AFE|nr:SidA/IucD/PvdA family monooxygenase [Arthrobacter gandavensis]MBF4992634.1 SidA/IucD/PvdA family monooxygenase [Arthrobacter gandavensis]
MSRRPEHQSKPVTAADAAEPEAGRTVHDIIGIGVGPFNLGLAALAEPIPELDAVFFDSRPGFDWHPGMMLDTAHLQVPFMADLVSLADPTSRYSFLNFLKATGRLYRFYIREDFYPLRAEFNAYCQWVAEQLPSVRFGHEVTDIRYEQTAHDGGRYLVRTRHDGGTRVHAARRLVLGTGTRPEIPPSCAGILSGEGAAVHNSDYLQSKDSIQEHRSITVVGSGQSAAEVFLDLLQDCGPDSYELNWVTRSGRFFPLEYTKLTLEMTSPDYVDYFHALPGATRDRLIGSQKNLYKGIDAALINEIYDALYARSLSGPLPVRLFTGVEVTGSSYDPDAGAHRLELHHSEQGTSGELTTGAVVLATGYSYREPGFLQGIGSRIRRDSRGRFDVDRNYGIGVAPGEIFVQNAELHTHGFTSPDLGMAAYRNSTILREILGWEYYPVEASITFQEFGLTGLGQPSHPPATARTGSTAKAEGAVA